MTSLEIAHWELLRPTDVGKSDDRASYFNKTPEFNRIRLITQIVNYSPVNLMVVSTDGLSIDLDRVAEVNCLQPSVFRNGYGSCIVNCAISLTPHTANHLFNPVNTEANQLGSVAMCQKEVVTRFHYQHFGNNRGVYNYNENRTIVSNTYAQSLMMSESQALLTYGGLNVKSKDVLTQKELLKSVDMDWSHSLTIANNNKHDKDMFVGIGGMLFTVRPGNKSLDESYVLLTAKKPKLSVQRIPITINTLPELITVNKKEAKFNTLLSNHNKAEAGKDIIRSEMDTTEVIDQLKHSIHTQEADLAEYIRTHDHNSKITDLTNKIIAANKSIDHYLELIALTNDFYRTKRLKTEKETDLMVVGGLGKVFL